jgi:flagellar hook-associated protein 3 FlgL
MPVADLTLYNSMAYALDQTTGNLQQLEVQMTSGKKVNAPSDDPVALAQSQLLNDEQSAVSNDVTVAQQANAKLTTIDGTLATVADAINSAISNATEGADSSVNTAQMATLAQTVQNTLNQVIGSANMQYGGVYVFAGNQVLTQPFNGAGAYSGDNGTNSVTFSNGASAQLSFDGQAIFGDTNSGLIGTLTSLVSALNLGNHAAVAATLPQLQTALQTLSQVRGTVAAGESTTSNLVNNSTSQLTSLQTSVSNLVGTDVAQAATQEQEITLQQQALVSLGSDLAKIPLINILA